MEEAFYLQSKAFFEKNNEHINEIHRLKAEVERLIKAGDAMVLKLPDMMAGVVKAEEAIGLMNDWIASKEGKPSV